MFEHGGTGIRARGDAKGRDRFQIRKCFNDDETTTISEDDVSAFSVERRDDFVRLVVDVHDGVLARAVDQHRRMLQWTNEQIG